MTLETHGYSGLHPVLPVEWQQASKEEMYAREDADDEAYLGVGEVVAPGAAVGEVEVEEDDPVTWLDQWKWAMEVEPDRKSLFGLTLAQVLERQKEVTRYVEEKGTQKQRACFGKSRKLLIDMYSQLKG